MVASIASIVPSSTADIRSSQTGQLHSILASDTSLAQADTRLAAKGGVMGLLTNGNRNIDVNKLVNQVRANGYVGVIVLDDSRPRNTGSHASHVVMSLAADLPGDLKPFFNKTVRVTVISAYADNGRRDLSGALSQARKLVDSGQAQVIISAADFAEDQSVTLPALSKAAGRKIDSFDQVRRSDLDQSLAQLRRQDPTFTRALDQVQELAGRVPYVIAGGNDGEGSALSLASRTINVGARNWDGSKAMTGGYFEAYASGLLPTDGPLGPVLTKGRGYSSYAAPRVAGDFVKAIARQAGL